MRRVAIGIAVFCVVAGLAIASFGVETIITAGGSVLTGVIETGLPAAVSVTSETG